MATPTRLLTALLTTATLWAANRDPAPWPVPPKLPDAAILASPSSVRLEGFLGLRTANNAANRLAQVDPEPLLAGFRQRPGSHPWIGEHVGKWLHAATLAWSYTGDDQLKHKLDYVVTELLRCQEPDGYLGTYTPDKRFGQFPGADWDVWSHKYNLLGLLTYVQYTGDTNALRTCQRMGDLLLQTFGPGKKSILSAGTHVGMAATSVLEPIVLLHRATGDPRYLEFARYLVRSWDEPGGPAIIATLLREKSVARTTNAKAYEMLSNLVGLCELARATGDASLLQPALIAWQDIVDHRLYLTGGASQAEHWHADHELPNHENAHVSETCVTVTWIQLNSQLLRLTGEARFGHELEKTFVNHLAAAQRPDGAQWCYFTPLEGSKPYGPGINCCVSSGPRGISLIPQHAFLVQPASAQQPETALVNLLENARAGLTLDHQNVILESTLEPSHPGHTLTIHCDQPARFALGIRTPDWSRPLSLTTTVPGTNAFLRQGWTILPARTWRDGDVVQVHYTVAGRRIEGTHGNRGRAALAWGPAILAYDEAFNPKLGPFNAVALANPNPQNPVTFRSHPDGSTVFEAPIRTTRLPGIHQAAFVLFADAGAEGSRFQVWLRGPDAPLPKPPPGFENAKESRSHPGNVQGSILDLDPDSYVVTYNAQAQSNAWFAVSLPAPMPVRQLTFIHGHTFHDGGWFDASAGKPRFEAQLAQDANWTFLAALDAYPATTGANPANLQGGESFQLTLPRAVRVWALRIIGTPAHGDNPAQAFASCAELTGQP